MSFKKISFLHTAFKLEVVHFPIPGAMFGHNQLWQSYYSLSLTIELPCTRWFPCPCEKGWHCPSCNFGMVVTSAVVAPVWGDGFLEEVSPFANKMPNYFLLSWLVLQKKTRLMCGYMGFPECDCFFLMCWLCCWCILSWFEPTPAEINGEVPTLLKVALWLDY